MTHPTAEQVLTVLNDGEPVDYTTLEWCVITGIHPSPQRTNYWPFERGELLVLNDYGREPFGEGRKPGKWDVIDFTTTDYDQAVALSKLVKSDARRGLWEWRDNEWVYGTGDIRALRSASNTAWIGNELTDDERKGWRQ